MIHKFCVFQLTSEKFFVIQKNDTRWWNCSNHDIRKNWVKFYILIQTLKWIFQIRNSKFIINLTCSIYSSIYSDVLMKRFPHLIVKYQFILHAEVIYELIKIHGISIFTQILIVSASHHCIFSFRLLIYIKEITLLNQGVGTFIVIKNKN